MKNTILQLCLLVSLILLSNIGNTQTVDFATIIPPMEQRPKEFEDLLVQLAWINNPSKEIFKHETKMAEEDVKLAKKGWMEILNINVGINPGAGRVDSVFNSPADQPTDRDLAGLIVYPRYSVGFGLSLAPLFTQKNEVNKAKEAVKIIAQNENLDKLKIRAEVKERYQKYLLTIEVLKARQTLEDDAKGIYDFFSELFKNNEAEYEDYSQAFEAYHSALEGRITAESEIEVAKIRLEELIGIDLEMAERLKKKRK